MNLRKARAALWTVGGALLGGALWSLYAVQPLPLIITAGLLAVTVPVDMMLRNEIRERDAGTRHGPVHKFGRSENHIHPGCFAIALLPLLIIPVGLTSPPYALGQNDIVIGGDIR